MQNKYIEIDETTWPRAMHCAIFRNSVEPAFCITFEADITAFKQYVNVPIKSRHSGIVL